MEQLIGDDQSSLKLNNALILSSFEGLRPEIFNMPAGQRTYSPYFCAITKGERKTSNGWSSKKQSWASKPQVRSLTSARFLKTCSTTTNPSMLGSTQMRTKVSNSSMFRFLGSWRESRYTENEYLPGLWSPRIADGSTRPHGPNAFGGHKTTKRLSIYATWVR